MPAPITKEVLSEIFRAYTSQETEVPSIAALKALADASGISIQAIKNRYEEYYKAVGNEDDPFAPFGGPVELE